MTVALAVVFVVHLLALAALLPSTVYVYVPRHARARTPMGGRP